MIVFHRYVRVRVQRSLCRYMQDSIKNFILALWLYVCRVYLERGDQGIFPPRDTVSPPPPKGILVFRFGMQKINLAVSPPNECLQIKPWCGCGLGVVWFRHGLFVIWESIHEI